MLSVNVDYNYLNTVFKMFKVFTDVQMSSTFKMLKVSRMKMCKTYIYLNVYYD